MSRRFADGEPEKTTRRRIRCPVFPCFRGVHSTITRSHSTSCELLTRGVPSRGLLVFRHLFVQKSVPKRSNYLTAFKSAPFVFKRLERAENWCFEQGSGWSKIPDCNPLPNRCLENRNGATISVMLTGKGSFGDPAWDQVKPRRGRLAPQEEPLSVMDLENQVSRQRLTALTALRCCQRGNLWVSVFKDRTSTLSILEFHRKKNEA